MLKSAVSKKEGVEKKIILLPLLKSGSIISERYGNRFLLSIGEQDWGDLPAFKLLISLISFHLGCVTIKKHIQAAKVVVVAI